MPEIREIVERNTRFRNQLNGALKVLFMQNDFVFSY